MAAAALAALSPLFPADAGAQAASGIVPTPRATAMPVTPASRPFLAAASAARPTDLAARGYGESEFALSGLANVYAWDPASAEGVAVRTAAVPYGTRLLVRQPLDRRRFSGLVIIEVLNPTWLHDTAPVWSLAQDELLRAGHAWVGVTVKPAALDALRRYDGARYAKVGFAFPRPADCVPAPPAPGVPGSDGESLSPAGAEYGLAYDAVAQAGALLRSGSRENPLRELEPRRIVAAGFGESADLLTTWLNARHSRLRLGDGSPIFDAFLQLGGGLVEVPLNQCATPLPPEDPRRRIGRRDVPVFDIATQSELPRALHLRREDSDDPQDFYRRYEVAGAAHLLPLDSGRPGTREQGLLGVTGADENPCEEPAAAFPLGLVVNGVVHQMQQLLFQGVSPVRAPLISTDAGQVGVDGSGNAIGGLRLPQVQVPLGVYAARSTPRRADDAGSVWRCSLTGTLRRFDDAELKQLYGTRAEYLRRFNAAVDQAVAERYLVPADAAAAKQEGVRTAPAF